MYNYNEMTFVKEMKDVTIVKGLSLYNILQIALFSTVYYYFAIAFGGNSYFVSPMNVGWVLPGFSLAILLLGGINLWPAIFIGSLLSQMEFDSLTDSLIITIGRTIEPLITAVILRHYLEFNQSLETVNDVIKFCASIAIGVVVAATLTVLMLFFSLYEGSLSLIEVWKNWCISHPSSTLMVTPLLLVWSEPTNKYWRAKIKKNYIESILLVLGVSFASYATIAGYNELGAIKYVVFLFIVWAALRFSQRGATLILAIIEIMAIISSIYSIGVFSKTYDNNAIILMDVFIIISSMTGLFLAASVSERMAAEIELTETKLRAQMIMHHTLYAIITINTQGTIVEWNKQADNMFGWSEKEALGKDIVNLLLPQENIATLEQNIHQTFDVKKFHELKDRIEVLTKNKNGHLLSVEMTVTTQRVSGKDYFTIFIRNIAEQVMMSEMKELLSEVVEASEDAIITKMLDGTITSWNKSAERLFGYSEEEMIGKNIKLIIPPDREEEEKEILTKIKNGTRIDHYETVRIAKDGKRVNISLSISPIHDRSGQIIGASKVAREVRKANEVPQQITKAA